MSDLHYLLALLTVGAALYAPLAMRGASQRLHYRDRPLFWRASLPLGTLALCLVAVLLLIWAFAATEQQPHLLWPSATLALLAAVAAWRTGLSPQRLVRRR
ncbi:hypothetical protein [Deinococcus navajonensis]|uniref:DUF3325 domain-containing protein n=1 Tax=Deinococcus navajonensis TaxID=309884 RepID=A0ABV8XSK3_9DEIO